MGHSTTVMDRTAVSQRCGPGDTTASVKKHIDGAPGEWWILGSTNYNVVDPANPRLSGDLVRRYGKPESSHGNDNFRLSAIGSGSGSGSGSGLFDTLGQWADKGRRSRHYGTLVFMRDSYLRDREGSLAEGEGADATTQIACNLMSRRRSGGQEIAAKTQVSSEILYGSSFQTPYLTSPAGGQLFRDRSIATVQGRKMPSFRDIFRQQVARAHRRHFRALGSLESGGKHSPALEEAGQYSGEALSIHRSSLSSNHEADAEAKDGSSLKGSTRAHVETDLSDVLFRDVARERLKRSFSRLSSNMIQAPRTGQGGAADIDVHPPESPFFAASKWTIEALQKLARSTVVLRSEVGHLQQASQNVERMAALASAAVEGKNGGQRKRSSTFDRPFRFGSWRSLLEQNSELHAAMTDTQQQEKQQKAEALRLLRQEQEKYMVRLLDHIRAASGCRQIRMRDRTSELCFALVTIEKMMEAWEKWTPPSPLILPAAIASLVCATAYYFCAVGCADMAAHSLYGQLVRYGTEGTSDESAVRGLRYSVLHNSMLEHLKLIDAIVVQILALVLNYERRTPSRRISATKLEVPMGGCLSAANLPRRARTAVATNHPNASIHAEILSVLTAAQYTILATYEAGGLRGETVSLEREVEQQSAMATAAHSSKAVLQKINFGVVELRIHMNKLLALWLALSELRCMHLAWDEINSFKDYATAYLDRVG